MIVAGVSGVGKTLLLDTLNAHRQARTIFLRINPPVFDEAELRDALRWQIEGGSDEATLPLSGDWDDCLGRRQRAGAKFAVLIDDAHRLGDSALESVLDGTIGTGLPVIIAGAINRNARFDSACREDPAKSSVCSLPSLGIDGVRSYVEHRLACAGSPYPSTVFSEASLALIAEHSCGVPREVNALCDAALSSAHVRKTREVAPDDVARAIAQLEAHRARVHPVLDEVDSSPIASVHRVQPSRESASEAGVVLARVNVMHQGQEVGMSNLTPGRLRIGRAADNELQILSISVSRHHCEILTHDDFSEIEEERSTNGVFVNGEPTKRRPLRDGDLISIGSHQLRYVDLRRPK